MVLGGVVALGLLGYAWQHYERLRLSYQLEQLDQTRSQAVQLNRALKLELATLRSPARIDLLARDHLGMTVPQPGQVIQIQSGATGEMADARTASAPASFR